MRAPLANRRLAHSARIRTGALDLRSSARVSTGDIEDVRAHRAHVRYLRYLPAGTYVAYVCSLRVRCHIGPLYAR